MNDKGVIVPGGQGGRGTAAAGAGVLPVEFGNKAGLVRLS